VREVLTNLAYSALVREYASSIKACLGPLDLGFQTPDGSALPSVLIQCRLARARRHCNQYVVVKLDLVNAYGNSSRAAILSLLVARLPRLVRAFLVSHEFASTMHFPGMAPVEVHEGLLQGDPAAPAFAQLLYSHVCQGIRDSVNPDLLLSFFDDIVVADDFDTAIQAVKDLRRAFQDIGLEVSLQKSVLFSNSQLSSSQRRVCKDLGLQVVYDGLVVVGSPVGTTEFIESFVEKEVAQAKSILQKIESADAVGRIHSPWVTTQGLFQLVRLSANNLLRHLLRVVDPNIIQSVLAPLDDQTALLVGRLFHASESDLTEVRRTRIGLPGSHGGLGIIPYVRVAKPAWLSCIYSLGPRLAKFVSDPELDIPQFPAIHSEVSALLKDDDVCPVPDLESFFVEEYGPHMPGSAPKRKLQASLMEVYHRKIAAACLASVPEADRFIFQVTAPDTAGDIFFVPITNRRNRVSGPAFILAGRMYLDLPVCSPTCNIDPCGNAPMFVDGQHAHTHARQRVKQRHDGIATAIGAVLRHLDRADLSEYECKYEVPLDTLQERLPKRNPSSESGLVCDLLLEHRVTGDVIVTDVRVTHPRRDSTANCSRPLAAAEAHWELKHRLYSKQYKISDSAIQPLVFEVYGGYAPRTYTFLSGLVKAIAGGDDQMYAKLWRDLRDRIAVALCRGQAEVVQYLNYRNGSSRHPWLPTGPSKPPD
jgi:hypothetical protein